MKKIVCTLLCALTLALTGCGKEKAEELRISTISDK